MRKPVIAGNWKMFKLLGEAVDAAVSIKPLVANANHCEVVIGPVFTALKTVSDRLEGSNVRAAAQNCATQNDFGAHTGEIAPTMLKDVGTKVLVTSRPNMSTHNVRSYSLEGPPMAICWIPRTLNGRVMTDFLWEVERNP